MNNELTKTLLAIGLAILCASCDRSQTAQSAQAASPTLSAGSVYMKIPSSSNPGGGEPEKSISEHKVTIVVLSPEEERAYVNGNATAQLIAKVDAVMMTEKSGGGVAFTAFTFEGIDGYYATLPLNIVIK